MEESTGETEATAKQEYKNLSNPDKVRAILGAVQEPVSKSLTLKFSGIDLDKLDEKEKAEVEAVFGEEDIEKSEVNDQERYWLSDAARNEIEKKIDMVSVHSRIADVLLERWREQEGRKGHI